MIWFPKFSKKEKDREVVEIIEEKCLVLFLIGLTTLCFLSHQPASMSKELSDSIAKNVFSVNKVGENGESEVPMMMGLNMRKYAHIFGFAYMGICSFYTINCLIKIRVCGSLLMCMIVAVCDEIHQFFIPGRSMMPKDVAIDWFGASIGITVAVCCYLIRSWINKNTSHW